MKSNKVKRRIDKMWKTGKKDLDRILKDTNILVKKGEEHIKDISKKAESNLEAVVLSLQREKLFYELGRDLAKTSKSKWPQSKKVRKEMSYER